jgi:hypothetical protein
MKASLPPSSIVLFFKALPASEATAEPARSLPVNATPLMRGSAMAFAACAFERNTFALERDRALRDVRRMFHYKRVA